MLNLVKILCLQVGADKKEIEAEKEDE